MRKKLSLFSFFLLTACAAQHSYTTQSTPADTALWQAAQEIVEFLPTDTADPAQGRLETGWGAPSDMLHDQYRILIALDYSRIYSEAVSVTVRHRVGSAGSWTDTDPEPQMAQAFEKAIGKRAGELRLRENALKEKS